MVSAKNPRASGGLGRLGGGGSAGRGGSVGGGGSAGGGGSVGGELDEIDSKLVEALRKNGRIPNSRLADLVGIAASTCITRVRSLEERGVITGYTALVSPAALGLSLQALISVSIKSGARHSIATFSDEIRQRPEVVQLFFLGGAEDFVIHVAARDSDHLREFVVSNLSAHLSVASTRTSIVFEHVVT